MEPGLPAFSSYDSDLWAYVLIGERVADGQDLLRDEPFRLEPPPSPQVSLAWLALGHLRRWSALPSLALVRGLGLASILLLCAGAWVLAGRRFGASWVRAVALLSFWVSLPETWSAVVLGRYVSVAFVALAAAAALDLGPSRRAAVRAGLFIALAFYAHLFGGVRRRQRRVHRALSANTPECWAAIFALYPDADFLLTPTVVAVVERRIWQERFPEVRPEEVRDRLRSLGVLAPVHAGPLFVLDALAPDRLGEGRPARTEGMGTGPRCREEP